MSSDKEQPEKSKGGSPIYRHGEATQWTPASGENSIEQISNHIKTHLGSVETVFHEIMSDAVHIDVHFVQPTASFPFNRIVTSGMSDLPMNTPAGVEVPKHLELMMTLPPDWRLKQESLKEEAWYWPVRLIKTLARLPHKHHTWLGWGHTVPNGNPAVPYAPNTKFCGAILLPSISAPKDFFMLKVSEQKLITFFAVVPIYQEGMDLKLRSGSDKLIEKFATANISDVVDPARPNTAQNKKWFGLG